MYYDKKIWIGNSGSEKICILPQMANRHGLIAGATGTGKTITLKVMAEAFSDAGVPVFLADIKGDLSGMARPGADSQDMRKRIADFGLEECGFEYKAYPCAYWDIAGRFGTALRTTVSEMGPLLLAKLLDLNPTQTDILQVVFKIADDQGLVLADSKDLKAMLKYTGDNNKELSQEYGNIAKQSVNAILRGVVALEAQGGEDFFAEPSLDMEDWFAFDSDGRGMINILDCRTLVSTPDMYAAFLLWLLSELFETLPEAGDLDKPKMVFFFDEAHLLFDGLSKALEDKIEQVVKLIRSKGVGIYFITQSPRDIPDGVLSQLGNKIQHALRAYTPAEEKAVKAAANSFRANPEFDTRTKLSELGTGEALVSVLDEKGIPGIVKCTGILPPQSLMGPISDRERSVLIEQNKLYEKYKNVYDRESAYEVLTERGRQAALQQEKEKQYQELLKKQQQYIKQEEKRQKAMQKSISRAGKSAAGTIGREIGSNIGKQLGGSFGKKVGGNLGSSLGRSILGTFLRG